MAYDPNKKETSIPEGTGTTMSATGTNMSTGNRSTPAKTQQQMSDFRRSFQDVVDKRAPKQQARRKAAQAGMGDAYKTDISKYDHAAHGNKKFDMRDVKHLRSQGYSDDDIAKYSSSLGADQLEEGLRQNNRQFAGQHAYQDMAKGSKISDHDVGKGFNISDVKYLRSQGYSDKDIARHAHESVTQGGKRHGNAMSKFMDKQGYLDYYHGDWKKAKGKAQAHSGNNVKDTGDVNNNTEINNQQTQNVNQNNDINTTVNGNNNTITNNQDNSIRNYGGDNRSLIINESNTGVQGGSGRNSRGSYYNTADKAITMGTLGGFYDVDDSPAGQAKFMDMNQTFNRDAQKRYEGFGANTAKQYSNYRSGAFNIENLQQRVDSTGQRFRDMATIQGVKTYGDRAAVTNYPAFEFGDPIKEITSNADKIAKGYKDDIDDV